MGALKGAARDTKIGFVSQEAFVARSLTMNTIMGSRDVLTNPEGTYLLPVLELLLTVLHFNPQTQSLSLILSMEVSTFLHSTSETTFVNLLVS